MEYNLEKIKNTNISSNCYLDKFSFEIKLTTTSGTRQVETINEVAVEKFLVRNCVVKKTSKKLVGEGCSYIIIDGTFFSQVALELI